MNNFRLLCTSIKHGEYLCGTGVSKLLQTIQETPSLQLLDQGTSLFWGIDWVGMSVIGYAQFEPAQEIFLIHGSTEHSSQDSQQSTTLEIEQVLNFQDVCELLKPNFTDKPNGKKMIQFSPTKVRLIHFTQTQEVSH